MSNSIYLIYGMKRILKMVCCETVCSLIFEILLKNDLKILFIKRILVSV